MLPLRMCFTNFSTYPSSLSNFLLRFTIIWCYLIVFLNCNKFLNILSMCTLYAGILPVCQSSFFIICFMILSDHWLKNKGREQSLIRVFLWGQDHMVCFRGESWDHSSHTSVLQMDHNWELIPSSELPNDQNKLHKLCGRNVNISQILLRFQIPKKRTINLTR